MLDDFGIDECFGVTEDIENDLDDWVDWSIRASFDPAEYAAWEANPYEEEDPPDEPFVTVLRP